MHAPTYSHGSSSHIPSNRSLYRCPLLYKRHIAQSHATRISTAAFTAALASLCRRGLSGKCGSTDPRIHGCTDLRIHECTDARIYGSTDPRIHGQYIFRHGSNRLAAATSLIFFRENDQLRWEISSYTPLPARERLATRD